MGQDKPLPPKQIPRKCPHALGSWIPSPPPPPFPVEMSLTLFLRQAAVHVEIFRHHQALISSSRIPAVFSAPGKAHGGLIVLHGNQGVCQEPGQEGMVGAGKAGTSQLPEPGPQPARPLAARRPCFSLGVGDVSSGRGGAGRCGQPMEAWSVLSSRWVLGCLCG